MSSGSLTSVLKRTVPATPTIGRSPPAENVSPRPSGFSPPNRRCASRSLTMTGPGSPRRAAANSASVKVRPFTSGMPSVEK
jgi:hypothetical protein